MANTSESGNAWTSANSEQKVVDPSESLERLRNRKKLQHWVMGITSSIDEEDDDKKKENHTTLSCLSPSPTQDEEFSGTPHSAATQQINNTSRNMFGTRPSLHGVFDFEPNFPDEDSTTAQTPEAVSPPVHDFLCVICKVGERTHLASPCMHFSFCGDCVARFEQDAKNGGSMRCIVCDEKAVAFSKVFY